MTKQNYFVHYLSLLLFTSLAAGCGGRAAYNPKNPNGSGPAPVTLAVTASDLGACGSYVILSKTGISSVPPSIITGSIGVSPAAETYLTGFSPVDATGYSTSTQVSGRMYAADNAAPTPSNLTTAISSMETAYTDAASRNPPDFNELSTGMIGGLTLAPGLYTWTTSITIPTDVTISGGENDVWIFQTTGDVTMSAAKNIILAGGAQAKNIFWQVAGQVTIGASAHFKGIILAKTAITLQTSATLNGQALSQTMVALDHSTISNP